MTTQLAPAAKGSRNSTACAARLAMSLVALLSVQIGCARREPSAETGEVADITRVERRIADAMFTVLSADRAVYAREVVDRLQNRENVLAASEHFRDERRLPLPAQMLRMGAEEVRKKRRDLSYGLISLWPINRRNAPRNDVERAGLEALNRNPRQPYTAAEVLGGDPYFTAIYPDNAVSDACVLCHNAHESSPRHDFKRGDVMGGVVIRVGQQ